MKNEQMQYQVKTWYVAIIDLIGDRCFNIDNDNNF